MTRKDMKAKITNIRPAGQDHQVVSTKGGPGGYRREPCSDCPWRRDAIGAFPASAFRHSANTAYDMAGSTFGCHQSGTEKPAMCAGFILRGAGHNMGARLAAIKGEVDPSQVTDGGHKLHGSYRAMAIANGVSPRAECLKRCRS